MKTCKVVGLIFKAACQIEPYYIYQKYDSIQNQGKNWSTFKTFPMHINLQNSAVYVCWNMTGYNYRKKWTLFQLSFYLTLIFREKFAELLQGYKEL